MDEQPDLGGRDHRDQPVNDERDDYEPGEEAEPDDEYDTDDESDDDEYVAYDESDEYVDDEPGRRTGSLVPFLLGALVGAVALGMVWGFVSLSGSDESRADTSQGGAAQLAASQPNRVAQCRAAAAAEGRALAAADSSLAQWQVHVAAMNRLVVGVITLKQASQFWNQTRRGAATRLARFLAADQQVRPARSHCPRSPGPNASKALRACSRAVVARGRALRAAETALGTWRRHVRDMEMLRMGKMSPAMATTMWLANWHKGVAQMRAYRVAVAHSGAGHC